MQRRKSAPTPPEIRRVSWPDGHKPTGRKPRKPSELRSFTKPGPTQAAERLQAALASGCVHQVSLLLARFPEALHWREGRGAHIQAAREGQLGLLRLLVQSGALLHTVDDDGQTALHCAVANGHVECARLLLDARAPCPEVVLDDDFQMTPVHLACEAGDVAMASLVFDRLRLTGLGRDKVRRLKRSRSLPLLAQGDGAILRLLDAWRGNTQVLLGEL